MNTEQFPGGPLGRTVGRLREIFAAGELCTGEDLVTVEEAADEIERLQADKARLDWMEANLCRAGEVRDSRGNCLKLARTWAIMGELETLRDTVDAAMTPNAGVQPPPKETQHG